MAPITLPETIKFGEKELKYAECNFYQRTIYGMLAKEIAHFNQLKTQGIPQEALLKKAGIVDFLFAKFMAYKAVTPINLYEDLPA